MWEVVDAVDDAGNGRFEDRAGAHGAMAWIIDGATGVSERRITGAASDTEWLVDRLAEHLMMLADEVAPLARIVASAMERTIADALRDWFETPDLPPSAALGVVHRVGDRTEFLVLADVSVILRTAAGVYELVDHRVDRHPTEALAGTTRPSSRPKPTFAH